MSKPKWLLTATVGLIIATAGAGITGFLIAALVLGVPYLVSCRLHPRTSHRGCGGSGRHSSPLYPWANRRCKGCGGTGRQTRHGTRVVGMPHAKAEHRAGIAARAKMKSNRSWR
jgi:hypothetical protein